MSQSVPASLVGIRSQSTIQTWSSRRERQRFGRVDTRWQESVGIVERSWTSSILISRPPHNPWYMLSARNEHTWVATTWQLDCDDMIAMDGLLSIWLKQPQGTWTLSPFLERVTYQTMAVLQSGTRKMTMIIAAIPTEFSWSPSLSFCSH